jgi:hypothetical protein
LPRSTMKTKTRVPPDNKQMHAEGTPAPGAHLERRGAEDIPFRQQLPQPSIEYRSAIGRWLRRGESVDDHTGLELVLAA